MERILSIRDLRLSFKTYRGEVKALAGVNLDLYEGEILALVGESGCGKSTTALAILGLLPENAEVKGGEIVFRGENLLEKSPEEMRLVRAYDIAAVFQDPMTYLNPVLRIETQIKEVIDLRNDIIRDAYEMMNNDGRLDIIKLLNIRPMNRHEVDGFKIDKGLRDDIIREISIEILKLVRLPDPERVLKSYPFELSGGMRQRVMIAMALVKRPTLWIADEVTTALDVTIQAQILALMKELRSKIKMSVLMITHDLSLVAEIADRVAVMYAGRVVEAADVSELFRNPLHPYTKLLLKSIPRIDMDIERLEYIPGTVPDLVNPPSGCRFHPRCPYIMDICKVETPKPVILGDGHYVECYLYKE